MNLMRTKLVLAVVACAAAELRPLGAPGGVALRTPRGGRKKAAAAPVAPPVAQGSGHTKLSGLELSSCIVADLCPHGMLPLAWAAAASGGTGAVPAVALITLFGAAGAYTLYLSAALADASGTRSTALSSIWAAAGLPAPKGVDALVATLCAGCCIFYAAFAADLACALAPQVGRGAMLAALGAVVAPLCLGDDLSVLKYSSYAGLCGVAYTAGLLGLRGLQHVPLKAAKVAQKVGLFRVTPGTAILANTLVVAYLCHYNALQYFRELEPTEEKQRDATPAAFGKVAFQSAAVTATVFATMLFGGRAAFGPTAMPNVLNNLPGDLPSSFAKLGTGVAILSGFPLMFAGLKAAFDGVVTLDAAPRRRTLAALLATIGATATVTSEDDIGLVIELLGSTLGCAAVYIVPGLSAAVSTTPLPDAHKLAGAILAGAGAILAVFGTYVTLSTHFAHH